MFSGPGHIHHVHVIFVLLHEEKAGNSLETEEEHKFHLAGMVYLGDNCGCIE
jgi:hypothetical protein